MLTAALAVLCALLVLVLLVQRPAIWPVLVVLAVLWFALFGVFRYRVRSWVARWVCGGSFEKSKTQFSLEPLSQPAALLSGETVLWYNTEFRTRLMKGEALLVPRVQKVLPGLDLQEARKVSGQLLNLADGVWNAHSSTVPGEAESMTLLVLNEETARRKVEAEYKASRPGYLVFLVDGYDDVFSDMLDSERARLLEGINRVLEDMIGRGTGFLRRVASGRYIAVVEERQLEQFANRGYDVLDKIRALDPSVNLHRRRTRGQDPAGGPGHGRAGAGYGAGARRRPGRRDDPGRLYLLWRRQPRRGKAQQGAQPHRGRPAGQAHQRG